MNAFSHGNTQKSEPFSPCPPTQVANNGDCRQMKSSSVQNKPKKLKWDAQCCKSKEDSSTWENFYRHIRTIFSVFFLIYFKEDLLELAICHIVEVQNTTINTKIDVFYNPSLLRLIILEPFMQFIGHLQQQKTNHWEIESLVDDAAEVDELVDRIPEDQCTAEIEKNILWVNMMSSA